MRAVSTNVMITHEPIDTGKEVLVQKSFIRMLCLLNIHVVEMGPLTFHLSAMILHQHTFKRY